jgi:hypothetical protein
MNNANCSSFLNLAELDFRKHDVPSSPVPGTTKTLNPPTVSGGITYASGLATFTSTVAHKLLDKQYVRISGAVEADYNGVFQVTVTGATTFTYAPKNAPSATPATGSPVVTYAAHAQRALLKAHTSNNADVTIGPNADADFETLGAGVTFLVEAPHGSKFDLAGWRVKHNQTPLAVNSITRVGQVATLTAAANHGLVTGQRVNVTGAAEPEYNIEAEITVTGAATFTYVVAGAPATPSAGGAVYTNEQRMQVLYA